ncbi:MAG: response regulator [Peptococcaceae bacterium]|nr:response regulator [Peptococcaceae bacterium]
MNVILVIDDDTGMCWALEKALQKEDFKILTAQSGSDGLLKFRSNHKKIKLVLLDIKLGDLNGLEVMESIKQIDKKVPILIMTGYSSMSMALKAIEKGAVGYLTKPLNVASLKESVEKIVKGM